MYKPKSNSKTQPLQTVISFLNRQQVDILDKIGKDALFSQGIKLSRSRIISCLIDLIQELEIDGQGISSLEELKQRIKERVYSTQPVTSQPLGYNLYPAVSLSSETKPLDKPDPGAGDKREFKRLKTNLKVEYRFLESLGPHQITSAEDLSIKGIRMELREYLKPETRLELIIRIPEQQEPLKVIGRVVWVKRQKSGLCITGIHLAHLKDQDKERFYKYVLG